MMSYEPTSTYKTGFRVFLAGRDERNPHNKSSSSISSSAGSCAGRDGTQDLISVNSEDYRDRRCIARRHYTAVYRLGESSLLLYAVRGAHRSVLVVVHAPCLCCWLFPFIVVLAVLFQRPRDFPRDAAAVTVVRYVPYKFRVLRTKSDANNVVFFPATCPFGSDKLHENA